MNQSKLVHVLYIIVAVIIGAVLGRMSTRTNIMAPKQGSADKLTYTMSLLEAQYVDQISRDSLAEMIIPELLKKLDPHSEYIPASMLDKVNEPLTGQFDGIGVMFNMMTDTALITNVITGGPSSKAGVIAGDRIMQVDDSLVAGIKLDSDKLVKKLRGKRGTMVTIGVLRNGSNELTQIPITRGVIPMKSLDAEFMVDGKIGFVKFSRFAATTYSELMGAMARLKQTGAKSYIIDLRGNGGGYLDQAILIANEFLAKGQGIVYTEGAHSKRREQLADGSGQYQKEPLTILIDEYSASASEILAGAIQDNDRGTIVGRRSFGKGLVQEQIEYVDGSAARITIARYYTPVGRSIQKPYKMGESDEYFMELYSRAKHSELFNVDSVKQNKTLHYATPTGKIVYGGGGIMPDEFVPIDTLRGRSEFTQSVYRKNLVFKYATKFTEENREKINQITTLPELDKYLGQTNLYADFTIYASQNGVRNSGAIDSNDRALLLAQIKGYIGRNTTLEDSAYFYYTYPQDPEALKAISSLEK